MTTTSALTVLFDRISRLYCFFAAQAESGANGELYRTLADGAHTQMMNLYRYIYGAETNESVLAALRNDIGALLADVEKQAKKEGRDAERLASWTRDAAKMTHMILEQATVKNVPAVNPFSCRHCGWTGIDEIPEKCPLCGKKIQ